MAMRKDGVRHLAVLEGSCALGVVGLRDLLAHMSVDEQQSHWPPPARCDRLAARPTV